jgi:hypothetical protein
MSEREPQPNTEPQSDTESTSDDETTSEAEATTETTELIRVEREIPEDVAIEIENLPRPLKERCEKILPLVDDTVLTVLVNKYRIGEHVIKAGSEMDEYAANIPTYRKIADRHVEHMAAALGLHKRTLYDCLRLVQTYSREEYQALISSPWITWEHVIYLLNAGGEPLRAEMQQKIEAEGWSPKEVQAAIHAHWGNRRQGSGRLPAVPKNIDVALHRLTKNGVTFTRYVDEACCCDKFDIATKIGETPPDEITDQTLQQLTECKATIESVGDSVRKGKQSLQRAEERVEQVLRVRAEQESEKGS